MACGKCMKLNFFQWTVHGLHHGLSWPSPTFIYKGEKFNLKLKFSERHLEYIMIVEPSQVAPSPGNITVQLADGKGRVIPNTDQPIYEQLLHNSRNSRSIDPIIWQFTKSAIANKIPNFRLTGQLTFMVNFGADVEVELKSDIQTVPKLLNEAVEDKSEESSIYNSSVSCLESLSEDLCKLMDQGHQQDLELACLDVKVNVHKIILSCRSEVFAAMLNSDMAESKSGTVDIKDMDERTFRHFVRYLYTGQLPDLTEEVARQLYEAADKYAVKVLMRLCARFLEENLEEENACEMLILADAHSDFDFKEVVVSFILETQMPVLQEDQWLGFCKSHPVLAVEILNRFVGISCEYS